MGRSLTWRPRRKGSKGAPHEPCKACAEEGSRVLVKKTREVDGKPVIHNPSHRACSSANEEAYTVGPNFLL